MAIESGATYFLILGLLCFFDAFAFFESQNLDDWARYYFGCVLWIIGVVTAGAGLVAVGNMIQAYVLAQ